ncbi:MAG TPA: alkaline phosphatase [Solirubrobacterales bacterium]|jgi:alkaline phosphatase/streptomycin-6-phosphatase|nr:alkaline phosphatase [Solirubrobacterales bacterium]
MKGKRFTAALAAMLALVAIGAGGAAATGAFSSHHHDQTERALASALHDRDPQNVIFLLGDGMGTQEITAARYYQGVNNELNVDRMPFTGFDTTWSVKPAAAPPYLPDYDPDSASTGTMWATGQKTLDERISQGPSSAENVPGANLKTVLELAQKRGMKVGDISTAEITDATPAVLASHISLRGCQGPANMGACTTETKAAGGLGSIAEQEVDHKVDVLLGGGRARFEQTIAGGPDTGKTVVQSAQAKGYQYVTDAAGLNVVSSNKKPLLGLFTPGNMSLEWSGPAASLGKGNAPAPCSENQRPANEPSLAAMTEKAIGLLDNRKGFFLQVEGASIDKQDHATNACGQIGETVAFDEAIGVALDYQQQHPDTLVVVTADHSHTSQIVSEDSAGSGVPTGYSTNLLTKDGQTLSLTYGTAGYGGPGAAPVAAPPSQQHTGAVVPVWASGPGALAVLGTNDHTDLFETLGG